MPTSPSSSRVRRAGKTLTSSTVKIVPATAGRSRYGTIAASETSGNSGPPEKTVPYAVRIGSVSSPTIHDECTIVSPSLARYSRSQPIGAATSRSRSLARKKVESAVMTLERSRIDRKASRMTLSTLPARRFPISCTSRI